MTDLLKLPYIVDYIFDSVLQLLQGLLDLDTKEAPFREEAEAE